MKRAERKCGCRIWTVWAAATLSLFCLGLVFGQTPRVSRPGQYAGFSQPKYKEWQRNSIYISIRDGTKLAADIFRPVLNGTLVNEPLPVIWSFDRYQRAQQKDGRLITKLDHYPWLQVLLNYGYVVAVVDLRGAGASFGTRLTELMPIEARDGYDVTEWLAAQPWCNGRVGMFGRSYSGITQYLVASAAPPHLVAVFPEMALFDLYSFVYSGGILRDDCIANWGRLVKDFDFNFPAVGVDHDPRGGLLAEAIKQHRLNRDVSAIVAALPYRNSVAYGSGSRLYIDSNPAGLIDKINRSGVAVYHLSGWNDLWSRDAILWFKNLKLPQKLVIGPWAHGQNGGFNLAAEHLRWYDYWLKGIDNGIMQEAPIHYYNMGNGVEEKWLSTDRWPQGNTRAIPLYFSAGGADDSRAGRLDFKAPASEQGVDTYVVDYTATSGKNSRWASMYGARFEYPEMTTNDLKGITYTTPPLESATQLTGHPIVHLWITSTARDGDFFVYLEDVDEQGRSHYVTEGALRASHRALSKPFYDNLGLPFHSGFKESISDLTGETPVELVFDLSPISYLFSAKKRIRVTITCADKNNSLTPESIPSPTVSIYRNARQASFVALPIEPAHVSPVLLHDHQSDLPARTFSGVIAVMVILASAVVSASFLTVIIVRVRRRAASTKVAQPRNAQKKSL